VEIRRPFNCYWKETLHCLTKSSIKEILFALASQADGKRVAYGAEVRVWMCCLLNVVIDLLSRVFPLDLEDFIVVVGHFDVQMFADGLTARLFGDTCPAVFVGEAQQWAQTSPAYPGSNICHPNHHHFSRA
jgi:hypothetical protein